MTFVPAQLMGKLCRSGDRLTPLRPAIKNKVDIPGEIAARRQRNCAAVGEPEIEVLIPVVAHATVIKKMLRLEGCIAVIIA